MLSLYSSAGSRRRQRSWPVSRAGRVWGRYTVCFRSLLACAACGRCVRCSCGSHCETTHPHRCQYQYPESAISAISYPHIKIATGSRESRRAGGYRQVEVETLIIQDIYVVQPCVLHIAHSPSPSPAPSLRCCRPRCRRRRL